MMKIKCGGGFIFGVHYQSEGSYFSKPFFGSSGKFVPDPGKGLLGLTAFGSSTPTGAPV
jgi:hypothetical protein